MSLKVVLVKIVGINIKMVEKRFKITIKIYYDGDYNIKIY